MKMQLLVCLVIIQTMWSHALCTNLHILHSELTIQALVIIDFHIAGLSYLSKFLIRTIWANIELTNFPFPSVFRYHSVFIWKIWHSLIGKKNPFLFFEFYNSFLIGRIFKRIICCNHSIVITTSSFPSIHKVDKVKMF